MRAGEHEVARSYVLYREERAKERREKSEENSQADELLRISVDGELKALDETGSIRSLKRSAAVIQIR